MRNLWVCAAAVKDLRRSVPNCRQSSQKDLEQHGIDETASRNLFMLAQLGEEGKSEALELIVKLQRKMHLGELDNASFWLHSCSSKARARLTGLEPQRAKPKYKTYRYAHR